MKRRTPATDREGAGGATTVPQARRPILAIGAIVAMAGLSGCASMSQTIAEKMSQMPGIGLSSGVPERPAEQLAYPAVHDMPPARDGVVLTDLEQQKLEDDLVAARDQQQGAVGIAPQARRKTQPSRASVIPASSRQTIY